MPETALRSRLLARPVVLGTLCVCLLGCRTADIPRYEHVIPGDSHNLILGAMHGDVGMVTAALEAGTDVNHRDAMGLTALMRAAREQHAPVVQLLLKRGADPAVRDTGGRTALWHAAHNDSHGRIPFTSWGFDLHLPRLMPSESARLLQRAAIPNVPPAQ